MDSYKKHNLITLAVAVLCVVSFSTFITTVQLKKIEGRRTKGSVIVNSVTNNIILTLNRYLTVTEFWNALIQKDAASVEGFDDISKVIYRNNQALNSIAIAPDGIVSDIYPDLRNSFVGLNLFTSAISKYSAELAKNSHKATITGPITLDDKSSGLLITQPVFTEGSDGPVFWGFSSATIKDKEFFSFVNFDQIVNAGYDYKLWDYEDNPKRKILITQSSAYELKSPTEYHFTVANKKWVLCFAPVTGWINYTHLVLQILSAIIVTILIVQLTHLTFRLRECNYYSSDRVYKDTLTQLFNARKFNIELEKLQRRAIPYGVICIDISTIKHVSDSFNHDQGNELIKVSAKKILSCIKESDRAYRIGGNQFAVVIHGNTDNENYNPICRRITDSLERETTIGSVKIKPIASVGLASFPKDGINFEDIVGEAEKAMYLNKYRKDKEI